MQEFEIKIISVFTRNVSFYKITITGSEVKTEYFLINSETSVLKQKLFSLSSMLHVIVKLILNAEIP